VGCGVTVPTRPVLRWLGGKFRLAPWIVSHFPEHRIYLEPFGGSASVLLHKPRAYNEIYNDLDGELVNLFQVLRGDRAPELLEALRLTPYARAEYWAAFKPTAEPVERARRTIVRSHLAHGTGGARMDRPTGFRTDGTSATTNVAGEWADLPDALHAVVERMRGVNIEARPALELIEKFNDPKR
jgi:DNA adenine methylase